MKYLVTYEDQTDWKEFEAISPCDAAELWALKYWQAGDGEDSFELTVKNTLGKLFHVTVDVDYDPTFVGSLTDEEEE